jgi:hypothetical protein
VKIITEQSDITDESGDYNSLYNLDLINYLQKSLKRIRGHLPIVPARHVLQTLKTVLANNLILTKESKKRKRNENSKFLNVVFLNLHLIF